MRTTIDPTTVSEFLAQRRIAVVGASDRKGNFGRAVYVGLKAHGHDVVAVHPTATVDGDPAHPDLASVPGGVDAVVVMVHRDLAADVVGECIDLGIQHVWLFRGGGGASAVSEEAQTVCDEYNLDVVAGACPLMFLEPVGLIHRIHRGFRHVNGSLARSA